MIQWASWILAFYKISYRMKNKEVCKDMERKQKTYQSLKKTKSLILHR